MCSERSDKVALLFEECVDIADPLKRAAYLAEACQGDAPLREEVESLLRAHERSGKFLMGGTPPALPDKVEGEGLESGGLKAGEMVGPYRLVGLIGEGSTSTVYLAEQEQPVRRWVALKVVKPGMDTRKVILRFSLERQALALMDHPGIAKLLDAGATASGRPFFVMELVSGTGITQYCDERQLDIRQRLELFTAVCKAVLHAHQRGIIHRDLKPDNILVQEDEGQHVLKIIDFGIAKVLHAWGPEDSNRTGIMPFLGTPAYMSPEQVQMTSPDLDSRTDIYSLGAVLYELLAGHPPFEHRELMEAGIEEMCRIIRTSEPPAPSGRFAHLPAAERVEIAAARGTTPAELQRTLAGDLDWITLKALEKNREQRYATTANLAEDISRHFENLPVTAAIPSRRYRLAKLVRRHRKTFFLASVIGTLLLASSMVITITGIRARINANTARRMEQAAVSAERQSHLSMVAMHVSSGMTAAEDRYHDKAVLWFANAARVAGDELEQAEVNAYRTLAWMSQVSFPLGVIKLPAALQLLEFSGDSRFLLALAHDRSWQVWDARTRQAAPWTAALGGILAAAWCPEGSRLAIVREDGEVTLLDAATGMQLHSVRAVPAPAAIGFGPDRDSLIWAGDCLNVYDLGAGAPALALLKEEGPLIGLALSGRTRQLVGVTAGGMADVVDLRDVTAADPPRHRGFPHRPTIRVDSCTSKTNYQEEFLKTAVMVFPALAADGSRLVTRTGTYEVTAWDLASGAEKFRIADVCCSCRFIADPGRDIVACGLQGGKVGIWNIITGEQQQLLPSQGACILDIAFGNAGRSLITADVNGMARLWSVEEGQQTQSPLHHTTDVDRVAYANDGSMVATGQSDGLIRVWDVVEYQSREHAGSAGDQPTVVRMDDLSQHFVLSREPNWEPCQEACISYLTVFSAPSGEPASAPLMIEGCLEAVAFSPDSGRLAVGIGSGAAETEGFLEIRGLSAPGLTVQRTRLPAAPASLAWSPDGGAVAVACRSGDLLVCEAGGAPQVRWQVPAEMARARTIPMTAYTPDGLALVVLGPDGTIKVRNPATGALLFEPLRSPGDGFWYFELSQDGHFLATTSMDGKVVVRDIQAGWEPVASLPHPGWVYGCHFSPDQTVLVTVSHDRMARLWDWRRGELLTAPMVHPSEVYDAEFTPDNRWLLTACRDGHVRIFEPHSGDMVAPPVNVGRQAFNIEITPDSELAIIGNLGADVAIVSLRLLKDEIPFDAAELCLIGEVLSGCMINKGSIRDLTTDEWLERYNTIGKLHPEALSIGQTFGLRKHSIHKGVHAPKSSLAHK